MLSIRHVSIGGRTSLRNVLMGRGMSTSPTCVNASHKLPSMFWAAVKKQVCDRVREVRLVYCTTDSCYRSGTGYMNPAQDSSCSLRSILNFLDSDGLSHQGRRFLFCDLLRDGLALAVVCIHCAVVSIIGGLIGASALPNSMTACCVPGSCLRMPLPAGYRRTS